MSARTPPGASAGGSWPAPEPPAGAPPWSRRALLSSLFLLLGALGLPRAGAALARRRSGGATLRPPLAPRLTIPESVRVVGREYLGAAPAENDPALLRKLLGNVRSAEGLDALVRADFAIGNIVQLRGWVLSRTEARWCALAALANRE